MDNKIYVVTAIVDGNGAVLVEVFEDSEQANEFIKNSVKPQLRKEYGDKMADDKSLEIGYHIRKMHENN